MEEQKEESIKNFSEKWLDKTFEDFKMLEEYEQNSKNGCKTILEFVQIDPRQLPYLQITNIELWMTKLDLVLTNIGRELSKEKSKEINKEFQDATTTFRKGVKDSKGNIYRASHEVRATAQKGKPKSLILDPLFWIIVDTLSKIRKELIKSLPHIFFTLKPKEEKERTI